MTDQKSHSKNGAVLAGPPSCCWNQAAHPRSRLSVLFSSVTDLFQPLTGHIFWINRSHLVTPRRRPGHIFSQFIKKSLCLLLFSKFIKIKPFLSGRWKSGWNVLKFNFIKREGKGKGGGEGGGREGNHEYESGKSAVFIPFLG